MTGGIRASLWCRGIPIGSTEPLPLSLISSIANEVGLAPLACQSPVSGSAAGRTADLLRLEGSGGRMKVPAALTASPAGSGCASKHPSRVLPAPGWITFLPPRRGGRLCLVDQLTAIGWITVTPPLKGKPFSAGKRDFFEQFCQLQQVLEFEKRDIVSVWGT